MFLQGVIILFGIGAIAVLTLLPLTEGRAANLDLLSIYTDPFILFCYVASIPFFIVLYKMFNLLGNIRQGIAFSVLSVRTLRAIKLYSVLLNILILIAGLYILIYHDKEDDPAGFLSLCIISILLILLFVTAVTVVEKTLKKGLEKRSDYEQSIKQ